MRVWVFLILIFLSVYCLSVGALQQDDPLPSWQASAIKQNILQFVNEVTDENNPAYVPPSERIATFDNDGTLWVEQPIYTQVLFAFDQMKTRALKHPVWKTQAPFKFVLNKQYDKLSQQDILKVMAATHTGVTVEAFDAVAKKWLATAVNPHFKQPYAALVYQPMLEVMAYLRAHQFKIYIVSGGGQDFMRAYAEGVYGVPPENVIGSALKTHYVYQDKKPQLMKMPVLLLNDNYAGKAENINLFIGKKPLIAFGNSTGDQQMLEWTQSNPKKHLMLLVHHDDAVREYAYDTKSTVGTFSVALMQEAQANHWQVISMKNDWKVIFPFEMKTVKE